MLMLRGAISLHRGLYDDTNLDQGPNLWRRVQHRPNDSGPLFHGYGHYSAMVEVEDVKS